MLVLTITYYAYITGLDTLIYSPFVIRGSGWRLGALLMPSYLLFYSPFVIRGSGWGLGVGGIVGALLFAFLRTSLF